MSLENLPDDIIIMIISKLENEAYKLVSLNKRFYNIGKKNGYMFNIVHKWNHNLFNLSTIQTHKNTLESISLENVFQPQKLIPVYPRKVILNNCDFIDELFFSTEVASNIRDLHLNMTIGDGKRRVNFSNLNLHSLYITITNNIKLDLTINQNSNMKIIYNLI